MSRVEPVDDIPSLPKGAGVSPPKSASFWFSLLAITIATFLAALDTVRIVHSYCFVFLN